MTIAEERIQQLERQAAAAATSGQDDLARDYVRRARRIAERYRIQFPRHFERFSCDRCDMYLRPGRNCRVRLQGDHLVIACDCGELARYGYK